MKNGTIKKLIHLGIGGVVLSFMLLGAAWLLSLARLQEMKTRLFTDTQSLQNNYRLHLTVLEAGNRERLAAAVSEADAHVAQLSGNVTSLEERAVLAEMEARYRQWREAALAGTSTSEAATDQTGEALVAAIRQHRAIIRHQMTQTMQQGGRLESAVRTWSPILLALAVLALGTGSYKLWTRIFHPMLRLSRAAEEFGQGDMQARAPVLREDEMGSLCRTFNTMAEAISDREQERLRFVATVAHDLKTPLVVIGGAAHLMQTKEMPPERQEEWLGRIVRNTKQMEGIIGDLMDGVQAQTGKLELHREELDLTELAATVVREYAAGQTQRTLRFEGDSACPILGDRRRLERVLINLLSNAIKYSPDESEVLVSVWRRDSTVRLTVEDHGVGIAPHDLERLFQPFTRLEGARHLAGGTGLGLVSVKKIIEAHGGEIHVISRLAQGTTVLICLKARL